MKMNLQKGLVGHWTLDSSETSNGTAYDSSANDNHGTINGATTGVSGIIGDAYDFDGSNDYVETSNSVLDGESEATFSWWMMPLEDPPDYLLCQYNGGGGGLVIYTRNSQEIDFWNDGNEYSSSYNWIANEWVHHTIVFNSGNLTFYTDETQRDVGSITSTSISTHNDPFTMASIGGGGNYSNVKYSDVRIYDRALSESEISALYNMREQRNANL